MSTSTCTRCALPLVLAGLLLTLLLVTYTAGPVAATDRAPVSSPTADTVNVSGARQVPHTIDYDVAGQLIVPRSLAVAGLLDDGSVLITGGYELDAWPTVSDSAQRFDPATGTTTLVGRMQSARRSHTATRLADGTLLLVGGAASGSSQSVLATAELYDPVTAGFTPVGNLNHARSGHTATRLADGSVLIAGGFDGEVGSMAAAERYDPVTREFSVGGNLNVGRSNHTATLLADGRVLLAFGSGSGAARLNHAELYDPATQQFALVTGNAIVGRYGHSATRLADGRVLLAGGNGAETTSVIFDPADETLVTLPTTHTALDRHAAALVPNGSVVLVGGLTSNNGRRATLFDPHTMRFSTAATTMLYERDWVTALALPSGSLLILGTPNSSPADAAALTPELAHYVPADVFSVTAQLPAGWWTANTLPVTVTAHSQQGVINAAGVYDRWQLDPLWYPIVDGATQPIPYSVWAEREYRFELYLRDRYGRSTLMITRTLRVDRADPFAALDILPPSLPPTFTVSWYAADDTSGVADLDLQVSTDEGVSWSPVLSQTTVYSTIFSGTHGRRYAFRVRARDNAGNQSNWWTSYPATLADGVPPTGTLTINYGAHATTVPDVLLQFAAVDDLTLVHEYRLADGNGAWSAWLPKPGGIVHTLPAGDGDKVVSVQYRDEAGNISLPVSTGVRLDTTLPPEPRVIINDGAQWTTTPTVTLQISGPPLAGLMQVSHQPFFPAAPWQPFDTRLTYVVNRFTPQTEPRVVFIRTREQLSTPISVTALDEIFYDARPPTGALRLVDLTATTLALALDVRDPDDLSGVAAMRIGFAASFDAAPWQPFAATVTLPRPPAGTGSPIIAQFRDGAGNISLPIESCGPPWLCRVLLPIAIGRPAP